MLTGLIKHYVNISHTILLRISTKYKNIDTYEHNFIFLLIINYIISTYQVFFFSSL